MSADCNDDDDGYEVPAPGSYREGERFEKMRKEYIDYVQSRLPKYVELADILLDEYSLSDAARVLGKPRSSLASQRKKLLHLAHEFIDRNLIV